MNDPWESVDFIKNMKYFKTDQCFEDNFSNPDELKNDYLFKIETKLKRIQEKRNKEPKAKEIISSIISLKEAQNDLLYRHTSQSDTFFNSPSNIFNGSCKDDIELPLIEYDLLSITHKNQLKNQEIRKES